MSTATYLDQIRQLVELQKVDDEIFSVRQDMESAPRELEELDRRFSALDAQRERIMDKLTHLREQQKRIAVEIDDDSDRLRKSRNKLMQVEDARSYHAMVREMDSMERINRSREEEKVALMEELQLQEANLAAVDQDHSALKAELEVKRDGLQEKLDACTARLESLGGVRDTASQAIPNPVFQRYEFIRRRLEHPVIVPVEDGICSGCHIAVPPQSFIELQRGQQILSCPNCQRLIYWCEHFVAPPPAPAAPVPLHD